MTIGGRRQSRKEPQSKGAPWGRRVQNEVELLQAVTILRLHVGIFTEDDDWEATLSNVPNKAEANTEVPGS